MKLFIVALFTLYTGTLFAASPKEVADAALEAWDTQDAARLYPLSHPELISRMKKSRLLHFYAEQNLAKQDSIRVGSAQQTVELFCEALALVVPKSQFRKSREYLRVYESGDTASVFYIQVTTYPDGKPATSPSEIRVVLKKNEEEWRILWLPAAQIHIDLTWEPE
jgi:ketosteroid isomerase-like protein